MGPDSPARLLVASNRGPVSFQPDDDSGLVPTRGAGGLVTALTEVMKDSEGVWVSSALTDGDVEMADRHAGGRLQANVDGSLLNLRYLAFSDETLDRYYNRISNAILWFMNHNMWNLPVQPCFDADTRTSWLAYKQVNRRFAEALADELRGSEGATAVMLQDYHLALAAGGLKQIAPQAFSYHFTHTPWAEPSTMAVLPGTMPQEVLSGMLANDLLGFHCPRWSRNFLWCCRQILGASVDFERSTVEHAARTTAVRDYPIAIDAAAVRSAAWSDTSPKYIDWLEGLLNGRQLVLRIDRFELSKNVLRGFKGFAQLLKDHPELKGNVVHVALLYPSRESLPEYKRYEDQVQTLATQINAELGTTGWQPIVLMSEANYIRAITSCRRYDVLMVNSISDGMNLVAKEGPVVNEIDGVVVLSKNAGAWDELQGGVLEINPYDIQQLADALYEGLTMPRDRRRRWAERNRTLVAQNTPRDWMRRQLTDIAAQRAGA